MKKKYIVKKNEEFNRIINLNKNISNKYFTIFYDQNNLNYPRFGITVSKKNGNAVIRNKNKRQIKNILQKKEFKKSLDCIIIIKKYAIEISFKEKEKNIDELLKKL